MCLTHKLVELQGISKIFLSRTAGFFTAKISYLAVEILCGGFGLSLFVGSCLSPWLLVYFTWVLRPLLVDRNTICLTSQLLLLFLTVVMDILWLWQKWGHLHARGKPLPTAGRFHLRHICQERHIWDAGLSRWFPLRRLILMHVLFIHLLVPVSYCFECYVVFFFVRFLSTPALSRINLISLCQFELLQIQSYINGFVRFLKGDIGG